MDAAATATSLFALGLGGGIAVTRNAHRHPSSPWWDRVGRTRLRRSDLPVVGTVALASARVLRATRHRSAALALTGLGLGAALGATGTGLAEPLPAVAS